MEKKATTLIQTMNTDTLTSRFTRYVKSIPNKLNSIDWSSPKNILLMFSLFIVPFVAGYIVISGLILGVILALGILFLVEKMPNFARELIARHPFAADLLLTSLTVGTVGAWFGSGLTLGFGVAACGLILSWALPLTKYEPQPVAETI